MLGLQAINVTAPNYGEQKEGFGTLISALAVRLIFHLTRCRVYVPMAIRLGGLCPASNAPYERPCPGSITAPLALWSKNRGGCFEGDGRGCREAVCI